MNELIKEALSLGAKRAYLIEIEDVPITWKATLLCLDCKVNNRPRMKRWSCPPYSHTPEETRCIFKKYERALLVNFESLFPPLTNHNWDTKNPIIHIAQKIFIHRLYKMLHLMMIKLQKVIIKKGYGAYAYGSSPCHACLFCGHSWYITGRHRGKCKKPQMFRFSPEASGIDLYKLAKLCNIPLEIPPTKKMQLMSLILLRENISGKGAGPSQINQSKCNRCGICVANCPVSAIDLTEGRIDLNRCLRCQMCIDICPQRAILETNSDNRGLWEKNPETYDCTDF